MRGITPSNSLHAGEWLRFCTAVLAFGGCITIASGQIEPQPPRISGPVSMVEAIRLAVKNSPVLYAARSDVDAAAAANKSARSRLLPRVSANGFAATSNNGSIVSSPPGVDPSSIMAIPNSRFGNVNLMLMFPLFTGGLLDSQARAASSLEHASTGDEREVEAAVALAVEEAYLRALAAGKNVETLQVRIQNATELVRTTSRQFDAGNGIEANVRRAEAELKMAIKDLATAKGDGEKAVLDLKATMGVDLDSAIALSEALDAKEPEQREAEYIRAAQERRGSLRAARARLESAKANVSALVASERPQLYAVAMADRASETGMSGQTLGLTLSVPLYSGGETRSEISRMKALEAHAEADLRATQLAVGRDVRQAWLDVQTAMENVQSSRASVSAAQAAYDVISLRVQNGKGILLEQLDALKELVSAKFDLAQSLFDERLAVARLDRAAGISPIADKADR